MDWQSAFHVPVSQPRPILPMQPGFRVDLDTRVGVAVGMVVEVGVAVGVPSNTVTGVLVAVGVWVGVGVAAGAPSEPPSSASSRAVSLLMSARSELINPPCSSIWSRWVVTWFRSVVICSCCVLDWASSWLILVLALPDVVTVVAVRVGVGVRTSARVVVAVRVGVGVGTSARVVVAVGVRIGAPLSSRAIVGVRVGVAVGGIPVAVGVAVGGVPVTVGVCVGVGVPVAVGVCVDVGVAVAETLVGVAVAGTLVGGVSSPYPYTSVPQHVTAPFVRSPQVTLPMLMEVKVKPAGG